MPGVLFIDDDKALLASTSANAQVRGFEIDTAESWDEGLASFHVEDHDLVVADYNMPGSRNGLTLLAKIKRLRPTVRVVLISGYLNETDMKAVEGLGLIDRALVKGTEDTTAALMGEIEDAMAKDQDRPIDWLRSAAAYAAPAAVSDDDVEALDRILRGRLDES